jgi:hypothetical protein
MGTGRIENDKVQSFTPLPYFAEKSGQGGADYPDAKLGWVQLPQKAAHAETISSTPRFAAGPPVSGKINIAGTLEHKRTEGTGFRGTLVSSRHGVIGQWTPKHENQSEFERISVEKGDTIDFAVTSAAA